MSKSDRKKKRKQSIGHSELVDLLHYNPETGIFTWLVDGGKARVGAVAGCVNSNGYRRIKMKGKLYHEHRLAWFFVHKRWPAAYIDHINGDKADNRISNLRESNNTQNMRNMCTPSRNTSGYKGVSLHRATGTWVARIGVGYKNKYLGRFGCPEEAHAAYCEAGRELYGEFFNSGDAG